jgi:hypothetical protein
MSGETFHDYVLEHIADEISDCENMEDIKKLYKEIGVTIKVDLTSDSVCCKVIISLSTLLFYIDKVILKKVPEPIKQFLFNQIDDFDLKQDLTEQITEDYLNNRIEVFDFSEKPSKNASENNQ